MSVASDSPVTVCAAFAVMTEIDREGFNPLSADARCKSAGAKLIYSHEGLDETSPLKLWKSYKFLDGSVINIHRKGCAVFSSGEPRFAQIPDHHNNSLW